MCLNVFIGSKNELPLIPWNEDQPGLIITLEANQNTIDHVSKILAANFVYNVGSHMGCACGLTYGEWSKNDENENHSGRVKDVKKLMHYLKKHKAENQLKLFCTWWEEFPENYASQAFDIDSVNEDEFEFMEDVILIL